MQAGVHAHLSHPQRIPQCIYKRALYIHKRALYINSKGSTFVQARKSLVSPLTRAHACGHPCALSLAPTRARTRVLSHSRPRVCAPVCSLTRAHARAHPCALSLAPTRARMCTPSCVCHTHTLTHPHSPNTHTHIRAAYTRVVYLQKLALYFSKLCQQAYIFVNLKPSI